MRVILFLVLLLDASFATSLLHDASIKGKGTSPDPNPGSYYLDGRGEGKRNLEELPAMTFGEKCTLSGCSYLPTPGPGVPRYQPNPYDGYVVITPPQTYRYIIVR